MKSNINQGCTAKTLHNTLSDCAYLFKNLRFLTVSVSEVIVEQLKKYTQSLIMSFDLVLSIFPKQLVTTYCSALILIIIIGLNRHKRNRFPVSAAVCGFTTGNCAVLPQHFHHR